MFVLATRSASRVFPQFEKGKTLVTAERLRLRVVWAEALLAALVASVLVLGLVSFDTVHPAPIYTSWVKTELAFSIIVRSARVQVSLDPDLLHSLLQVLPRLGDLSAELDVLVLRLGPALRFWLLYELMD